MATLSRTIAGRVFEVEAKVRLGSPGTYWDPPDGGEIDEVAVHEGDVEIEWGAFEELLAALLGAEGAHKELEAINEAIIAVAEDDYRCGGWP